MCQTGPPASPPAIFITMKDVHNSSTPEGYHTLTAALVVKDGRAALDFYERALGATVRRRMDGSDDSVMHAELEIGDSCFMVSDEMPEWGNHSPQSLGGTPVSFCVYVADVDAAFARATGAGGKELMPVADQFWGDRVGMFLDPFGHKWSLATRIEEVSDEETNRRGQDWVQENPVEKA